MSVALDLMPPSYRMKLRRGRFHRHVVVALCVGGIVVGAAGWSLRATVMHRRAELRSLTTLVAGTRELACDAELLQRQIDEAARTLTDQQELTLPLSATEIIATLAGLMPAAVTFDSLELRVTTRDANGARAGLRASHSKDSGDKETVREVMICEVTGVARSDLDIADFVTSLTDHALFGSVSLDYSKPVTVAGVSSRSFRVSSRIDLEVEYVAEVIDGEEIAAAPSRRIMETAYEP
ncbi:MAG: hypothetical protein KAS72_13170 [Phycisphaerales bacterium]|nr:hypothetical protein [Phycisphaerales bacterium]